MKASAALSARTAERGEAGSRAKSQRAYSLQLSSLIILAVVSLASLAPAAESLCEPGFVHGPGSNLRAIPVAASTPDTTPRVVTIQWLGHSSFLIITPGGTTALTDPHSRHASPTEPDIVTISNEHPTHNQVRAVPGSARVLRGRTPEGEWIEVNVTVGDLSIKTLPSSGGNAIDIPVQNTIFVFRAEGLCIVHLGNLRSPLNETHRQRLGRPDVLMIPIDGQLTLSYDQIVATITQLRPAVVLPMHYDFPEHARLFMEFIKATVPVRTMRDLRLKLTRATLPGASEVIVLGYRGGDRE
jgi:L-ascorbate metabolism protein UlaG (beta-lactamase superfamily)